QSAQTSTLGVHLGRPPVPQPAPIRFPSRARGRRARAGGVPRRPVRAARFDRRLPADPARGEPLPARAPAPGPTTRGDRGRGRSRQPARPRSPRREGPGSGGPAPGGTATDRDPPPRRDAPRARRAEGNRRSRQPPPRRPPVAARAGPPRGRPVSRDRPRATRSPRTRKAVVARTSNGPGVARRRGVQPSHTRGAERSRISSVTPRTIARPIRAERPLPLPPRVLRDHADLAVGFHQRAAHLAYVLQPLLAQHRPQLVLGHKLAPHVPAHI